MKTDVRHSSHPDHVRTFDTQALRDHFLIENLFVGGEINLTYTHYDRMIIGGAMPLQQPLVLEAPEAVGQETFLAERELGILNIGDAGRVILDGKTYDLNQYDCLYVGKGVKQVQFESLDSEEPAKYYLISTPAHAVLPAMHLTQKDARHLQLGDTTTANKRSIFQYIHPDVCQSCQLTMGMTMLDDGSVWNTMPSHTHDRRMEAYLYFNLPDDQRVFHLMGEPTQTRHMLVSNEQAVISPPWSIHSGAGTSNYTFIWAMGGDNKSFTDMDHIANSELR
ncbi:5-dehydro-4-deoxy-D-glucuronate isomerase [Paraburkholderia aspalathi]|nr:5-dehydro-4-deoxy-D-glucuronate isomerase [Paraburkholderia aspalathi]